MAEFYCYKAKEEYYKLETDSSGKGFRFHPDKKQSRMEFFGFEERTAEFIQKAMETGQVVKITKDEFILAAKRFWTIVSKSLTALDKLIGS